MTTGTQFWHDISSVHMRRSETSEHAVDLVLMVDGEYGEETFMDLHFFADDARLQASLGLIDVAVNVHTEEMRAELIEELTGKVVDALYADNTGDEHEMQLPRWRCEVFAGGQTHFRHCLAPNAAAAEAEMLDYGWQGKVSVRREELHDEAPGMRGIPHEEAR